MDRPWRGTAVKETQSLEELNRTGGAWEAPDRRERSRELGGARGTRARPSWGEGTGARAEGPLESL